MYAHVLPSLLSREGGERGRAFFCLFCHTRQGWKEGNKRNTHYVLCLLLSKETKGCSPAAFAFALVRPCLRTCSHTWFITLLSFPPPSSFLPSFLPLLLLLLLPLLLPPPPPLPLPPDYASRLLPCLLPTLPSSPTLPLLLLDLPELEMEKVPTSANGGAVGPHDDDAPSQSNDTGTGTQHAHHPPHMHPPNHSDPHPDKCLPSPP